MRGTRVLAQGLVAICAFVCLPSAVYGAERAQELVSYLGAPVTESQPPSDLLSVPANLDVRDVTVEAALRQLQISSGVPIAYSPTLLPSETRVTCACRSRTVGDAVSILLRGTGFEARPMADQLIVRRRQILELDAPSMPELRSARLPSFAEISATTDRRPELLAPVIGTITGTVADARTGRPISGAQAFIPNTGIGVLSNAAGRFVLLNVPDGTHEVRIEIIGYAPESQTVTVVDGATLTLTFRLSERAMELNEIVVTGTAGAQQMRSLGNVVGRVQASRLQESAPAAGIEELLSGAEPGMTVDFGGLGGVGGSANIRIRGAASMALSSQPLLYIDGVRVNGGGTSDQGLGNSPPTRLNDLSAEEIESIEIIKGPAAATLYGTEASNGVINIITKRGVAGDPTITLRVGTGANWYPNMEKAIPSVYYRCQGTSGDCTVGDIVEFNVLREDRLRTGAEHFRTGLPQSYGASIQGGSDQFRFFTSLDWDQDKGAMPHDWKDQLNGRANLTWTPNDEFDVRVGLAGVQSKLRDGGTSYVLGAIWACPAPGCEEGSGTTFAVDGPYRGYIAFRPDVMRDSTFQFQEVSRSQYNVQVTHRPTGWLSHRLVAGADWTDNEITDLQLPINGVGHLNPQGQRSIRAGKTRFLSLDYSATANWEANEDFTFSSSGGFQFYAKQDELVISSSERFATKGLETLDAGSDQSVSEDFIENKTVGVYVQEQIGWKNRLFLTAAVRGDDNSAFGTDFEAITYPKVSASWVISEEDFLQDVSWLSQLRARGAWGRAGQQPDAFAATRTLRPIPGPGGAGGLTFENFGNPGLKPEVGQEFELGFDAGLFNDRVGVEFTYYAQNRSDAIIPVSVRPSTGFPGVQFKNLGKIENNGFELQLSGTPYQANDLGIDLTLSIANNESKITDMGSAAPGILQTGNPTTSWSQQLFVEGFPLGAIWQKKVVSADIQGAGAAAVATNVMCEGGSILAQASADFPISGGGGAPVACASAPHIYRGTPIPTWTVSGSTNVSVGRSLSLYAQVDYKGGHTMIDGNAAGSHIALFRQTRGILERTDPILLGIESLGRDGRNQSGLIDASFARLRRIGLTYTLPEAVSANIGAERTTLTLSGQNLWLIWRAASESFGHPLIDPEVRATVGEVTDPGGLSAYTQSEPPPLRRFTATLRITF